MSESLGAQLQNLIERLKERQTDLKRLDAGSIEARSPVELDQSRQGRLSRMDALQSQAMAVETARRRQMELQKIEAALGRLQDGDYGYCVNCGECIGHKRLELDPATPLCIDCAEEAGPQGMGGAGMRQRSN